jgi:hypothetical protein
MFNRRASRGAQSTTAGPSINDVRAALAAYKAARPDPATESGRAMTQAARKLAAQHGLQF